LFKSDHTFLDGSNKEEKDKVGKQETEGNESKKRNERVDSFYPHFFPRFLSLSASRTWQDTSEISKEDAEKLFRYSDQTCVLVTCRSPRTCSGLTFPYWLTADHIRRFLPLSSPVGCRTTPTATCKT
jgi:hypothetical protein